MANYANNNRVQFRGRISWQTSLVGTNDMHIGMFPIPFRVVYQCKDTEVDVH